MGDFDFPKLTQHARKIDEGLLLISEKLQNPLTIGSGENSSYRLDVLEETMTVYEKQLEIIMSSLTQKISEIKDKNRQREELLEQVRYGIKRIEEAGKDSGFTIPEGLNRLYSDDISPVRSPGGIIYQETPLSSYSISK